MIWTPSGRQTLNRAVWTPRGLHHFVVRSLVVITHFVKTAGGDNKNRPMMKPWDSNHVMVTWPDCETRATNGPGREWRTLRILGSAARKTSAISMPRRLPAVRTNTLALLALSAAISSGRYLSL